MQPRISWTDVRDEIHARLLNTTYKPGDKLPRDEDLAAELGCARSTVHRAMQSLADAGLVERRRKGGTSVPRDPVTRATLDIPVIRREVEALGLAHGYHLIEASRSTPPPDVKAVFTPMQGQEMLHVTALHLADGRPYIFEDRWISLETVPEIASVDLERESANEWLVRNRPYSRCDLRIYARSAGPEDASRMGIAESSAVLVIDRTTWIGDDPITNVRATTAPGYRLRSTG